MADLDRGEFIKQLGYGQRDFSGIDLSGTDLSNLNLSGVNFAKANLAGAKLHNTQVTDRTNISGANLRGASLVGASFGYDIGGVTVPQGLDTFRAHVKGAALVDDATAFVLEDTAEGREQLAKERQAEDARKLERMRDPKVVATAGKYIQRNF